MKFKVVVIDDHPMVRTGLVSVLASDPSIEVTGEAGTVSEALEVLMRERADLALVDLRLGDSSGLEVIEQAQKLAVHCRFAILTSSTHEEDFFRAEQLGISGYLLKEALPEEIIYAIKLISQGRKYYDPAVLDIKMRGPDLGDEALTPREQEVLKALGKGLNNRDIAAKLYLSENTVRKYVSQILDKLNLADRTQAALYAYSKGLVL